MKEESIGQGSGESPGKHGRVLTDAQKAALAAGREKRHSGPPKEEERPVLAPEGASEEYAAMYHVARNDKKWDRTFEHRSLREFLDTKPDKFREQLTELGREHRILQGKGEVVGVDEGSERVLKLVEELLAKLPKD